MGRSVVWFRQDLRLGDNPALAAALAEGEVIPLYIFDETARPALGGASRWWLHQSLDSLERAFRNLGSRLVLRRGDPGELVPRLLAETGAGGVYFNRCYEPHAFARDKALKRVLAETGLGFHSFNGSLLYEPWSVKTKDGNPFRVFTPFWTTCRSLSLPQTPLPGSTALNAMTDPIQSDDLDDWGLLPTKPDWAGGLRATWRVGEEGAREQLDGFLTHRIDRYAKGRDFPDAPWTSRLSPHLHWGEVSPRQIYHAMAAALDKGTVTAANADKFLAELGWREFSYHLLFHNPTLPEAPLQPKFRDFPWDQDARLLRAWQRGATGYPIVDAGMRELWATGYMHNRVRMITASFLVKNLLQPWVDGAAWFWDTLCDADLASNSASWQWVAGCGADAAPYFRVFNPVLQGKKFDPEGSYVKKWAPELADVPAKYIHSPWELPKPPSGYPAPIVDLMKSRARALQAFQVISAAASSPIL